VGIGHIDSTDPSRIQTTAGAVSDQILATHPDAVYCGCDQPSSYTLIHGLRAAGSSIPVLAYNAIWDPGWIQHLSSAESVGVYVTVAGLDPSHSTVSFRRKFASTFHTSLQEYDDHAYDAATVALDAMYRAAAAGRLRGSTHRLRVAVLDYIAHARVRGATGITSFDANGDTKNRIVSVYRGSQGRWKFDTALRGLPATAATTHG
jgi:branched-chain amino acid transport system substrate-binding protein